MRKYNYHCPTLEDFQKFKLSKKQHNNFFPYRKKQWHNKFEYYYKHDYILLHKFVSLPAVILYTLLFPICVLREGFGNIREVIDEYKRLYRQKERGSFIPDRLSGSSDTFAQIKEILDIK